MELYLLDKQMQICSMPLEDFTSLQWTENWSEPGKFDLRLDYRYFPEISRARYIYNTDAGKAAIIETISYTMADGQTVQLTGRLLESLLTRRIVEKSWRTTGTVAEQAHKTFLHYASPGGDRALENVTDGAAEGYTDTGDIPTTGGQTLADWAYTSLNSYDMTPEITYDFAAAAATFGVRKRTDRTQGNAGGLSPVLFSQSFENTKNDKYGYDETELKNHAYVVMEDDPCYGRQIVEISTQTTEEPRVELYVKSKASSEPDKSGGTLTPTVTLAECKATMAQEGREALQDRAILESVTCEIETNGIYEYRRDYAVGDLVNYTSSILGVEMAAQITAVTEVYERGARTIKAQIGKDFSAVNYLRRLVSKTKNS